MANFGKIILFRIEDLLPENNQNAYYPTFQDPTPPGTFPDGTYPFARGTTAGNEFQDGSALEETWNKWYRILGKNYKLDEEGALVSVIYDKLSEPIGGAGFEVPNYFSEYKYLDTTESGQYGPEDLIEFTFGDFPTGNDKEDEIQYMFAQLFDRGALRFTSAFHGAPEDERPGGFTNHNLSLPKPLMSNQNQQNQNFSFEQYGIGDTIKIKPIYNYYLKDYEQFYNSLSNRVNFNINYQEEKSIPNFYYLITLLANPDVFSEVTSNSNVAAPFTIEGILEGIIPSLTGDLSTAPLGTKLATEILAYEQESPRERNSVVVVTPSFYKALSNEISTQKRAHPFYNQIEIPITKGGTVFRDLFKKAKIYEQLQHRAGLQIRIINQAARFGKNLTQTGIILNDLSSGYNLFYTTATTTKYTSGKYGIRVEYKSADQRTTDPDTFSLPYESSPPQGDEAARVIEFDVSLHDEGDNYDFKLGVKTGQQGATYINFNNNYISRVRQWPVENGKLDSAGVRFNLTKINQFTTTQDDKIINPLTFYANNPESENSYISSVIQNKANSILEYK